jgi:protein-disulfide isomerase
MARLFATLATLFALLLTPASAQSFNAQEQAEMRAIVREYLINNPDVLREALDALAERTEAQRWREIKSDPRDFTMGPADAQIVIVEFFDYRCGFCHAALEWVTDVARTRRDVRIVLKEFPILSEESMEASRAAIAAMPQGRYWQFHQRLMAFRGELSSARIDQIARESGIDVARMRRGMSEPAITDLIMDNRAHAIGLDNTATPIFIINGEMIRGFRPEELDQRLREATTAARRTASR